MKQRKLLAGMAGMISLAMTVSGCGSSADGESADETSTVVSTVSAQENTKLAKQAVSRISYKELARDKADCQIVLDGNETECNGKGASYESGVVTIDSAGCYEITGTLEDGRIEVKAGEEDEVEIILNGVNVICSDYAPFVVWQAKETIVYLVDGTQNSFTDADSYQTLDGTSEDDTPSAAVYSKDDIVFGGEGVLKVTAQCNDGISGRDDVQFVSGTYEIEAADDGIVGKDSVAVKNGVFTISAESDGIKSTKEENEEKGFLYIEDGSFDVTAGNDAFQAESYVWVAGGEFTIETGGGCAMSASGSSTMGRLETSSQEETSDSCKGLKAGVDITVEGGTFRMDCADDAVHSNGTITVRGGAFDIQTGDDGIHADYEVAVMDGTVTIAKSYEGVEGQIITIGGGVLDITASDDGINAAESSSAEGDGNDRNMGDMPEGNGGAPQMPEGTDGMPQMGERPEGNGGAPQMPEGTDGMPQMGERPEGNGEAPQMGEKPDENGQAPDMNQQPDGGGEGSSNAVLTITGGEIRINAGGDGLDSNGTITMSGGTVYVDGPVNDGNGILDYDKTFEISGGTLIGAGSSGMLQTISDSSSQAGLAVVFDSSQSAGTVVTVKDSAGKEVVSYQPSKSFTAVVLSDSELEVGETYDVYLNDTVYKSIELTSVSTTDGASGMGGGMNGPGMSRPDSSTSNGGRRNEENPKSESDTSGTI